MDKSIAVSCVKNLIKLLMIIFIIWLIFAGYMYFTQDSYVFFPNPISEQKTLQIKNDYKNVEELSIKTADGNVLVGWLVKNSKSQKSPLIIFFGGNDEEVSHLIEPVSKIDGWDVALINYRGYGTSTGKPEEKELFSDSTLIYDCLCQRSDIDNKNVVAFGRSLGTGVAVNLAADRNVQGVILATPYDSLTSIAKENYPFLPIDFIMRNKFDSLSRVPFIKAPILVLAAENDQVVTRGHTLKLVEGIKNSCKFITVEKTDHANIYNSNLFWNYVKDFLKQLK